jgi:short-subunit dehydrogenase
MGATFAMGPQADLRGKVAVISGAAHDIGLALALYAADRGIAAAEVFGIRGAAPDVAITHAIVGLSESLYRELDSMGSRVGVTLVCPAVGKTTIASAPEYQNSVSPSMRYIPLNSLPPDELAEQIFAAVDARRFWFRPHTSQPHEMSGPSRASRARTS